MTTDKDTLEAVASKLDELAAIWTENRDAYPSGSPEYYRADGKAEALTALAAEMRDTARHYHPMDEWGC